MDTGGTDTGGTAAGVADPPTSVGPFDLEARIGKGAMGVVWRAVHRATGRRVAIKIVGERVGGDPLGVGLFLDEVRAMAALHHPGVAAIHDYGELGDGSPFLAMELVTGGSLWEWQGRLDWPTLRHVLLRLLDALSHAHARGLVHRDLKPANVLVSEDLVEVKLTDFGLAASLDVDAAVPTVEAERRVFGTPAYLAPEQIQRRWRDYGPWTDLYALGCLAWALATGQPPFRRPGGSLLDVLRAQLETPPDAFAPRGTTPPAFEGWLRTLLRKAPGERFQCAADAAWALRGLEGFVASSRGDAFEPEALDVTVIGSQSVEAKSVEAQPAEAQPVEPQPAEPQPAEPDQTRRDARTPTLLSGVAAPEEASPTLLGEARAPTEGSTPPAAPMPVDWRREQAEALPPALGLFGLRAVPLIGRDAARDTLWQALRAVSTTRRARAVVLTGPAGVGKSRLAQWLGHQAHEVGAAQVLRLLSAPIPGRPHGLDAMLERAFRCADLGAVAVRERVAAQMAAAGMTDPDDAQAVADLIRPPPVARTAGTQVGMGPRATYAIISRLLAGLAVRRPVLVQLEDVQWSRPALDFAAALLEQQQWDPAPVLLVLGARSDALAECPDEAAALLALQARPGVSTIEVGPLPAEACPALLHAMLGADAELTDRLARRSGGNPLFAIHLANDWIERGLVEGGLEGARLRPGARTDALDLPADLHAVWGRRVDRLLAQRTFADRAALELAAVLGQDVAAEEWRAACAAAGVSPSADLVEALLRQALAERGREGAIGDWSFVHGMLRESLERAAREAGRLAAHHRACAAVVPATDPGRTARHLLAAGEPALAVKPLLAAVRHALEMGDFPVTSAQLTALDEALAALGAGDGDPRHAETRLLRARLDRHCGETATAEADADAVIAAARAAGWRALLAEALVDRGSMAVDAGVGALAAPLFDEALRHARALGDQLLVARCRQWIGIVYMHRREFAPAERAFAAARDVCDTLGEDVSAGHCEVLLGRVAQARGDLDGALVIYRSAHARFGRAGSRVGLGATANQLGEIERMQGRLAAAEPHYQEALRHWSATGAINADFARANLALVRLERGGYAEARPLLLESVKRFERAGWRSTVVELHACLVACAAGCADWDAFDAHLTAATAGQVELARAERDAARMLTRGGLLARDAGQGQRARDALALAVVHWRGVGDAAALGDVEAALAGL